MLASSETPRPLPPAKARKASALHKTSTTPPPAYGSPITFPLRRQVRRDILGSPMSTTFQMVGWGHANPGRRSSSFPPLSPDDGDWMNEKSRQELKELLFKADGIIKERENELGLTSAVCKNLYENNVALKSKHQALLARIPMSPARSTSSPEHLSKMSSRNNSISLSYSNSESALGLIKSPCPSQMGGRTRKVSIATADMSLLADQNAELLEKLVKLEEEATCADQAGRRELKRLGKEITFLREALEKTQAKSDALEEKVQDAVAGEASRRKKEREAKFKAMRNLGREPTEDADVVRNFAPEGSKFGGPTETFTFFPVAESPDPNRRLPTQSSSDMHLNLLGSLGPPEHTLISQLLVKVQELEETNGRILAQQSETANQVSAVQRDTMHISKVYECLADHDSVELELEQENDDVAEEKISSAQTIRFRSLKRNIENDMSFDGTCIVRPDFTSTAKNRKTVMGLFDEQEEELSKGDDEPRPDDTQRAQMVLSPWSEGHDRSSWSSHMGGASPSPGVLSPLHFFSPPSQVQSDMSPIGLTLQNELDKKLGNGGWDMNAGTSRLRTSSLYDLSQFSIPPSPTPTSRTVSRRTSDELDYAAMKAARTPFSTASNPLRLSVEPPTPDKDTPEARSALSPRIQLISETLRSRTHRWVDRRIRDRRSQSQKAVNLNERKMRSGSSKGAEAPVGLHQRLSNAVDSMVDKFRNDKVLARRSVSSLNSPPFTLPLDEDNALQLRVDSSAQKTEKMNPSFLFQAWLWLQFAIVIFVFLFAMAKKGPTVVLSEENRRDIARRR